MTQQESPDLEEALDGLQAAERYAASIGEEEIARRVARCYQLIGREAPDDHWDDPDSTEF